MMRAIRAIVVDDEPLARASLRVLLEEAGDIELVAVCANGAEAIDAVTRLDPDLLFLDIKMPKINGLEVLARIEPESWPFVVFVTAFDQFAVRAFEMNALDYLLKPFDDERFHLALDRARKEIGDQRDQSARLAALLEAPSETAFAARLAIRETGRVHVVEVDDLSWAQASGNYVELHTDRRRLLMRSSITALQHRLDPARFVRIHRSTLVQVSRIDAIKRLPRGDCLVVLDDGTELRGSRRHRRHLDALISGS